MEGVLYVVATPIGNLKDITLRAIEVLKDVDLIVAENRERALKLLSHLSIHKPIITINSYNEERKANNIARQIASGEILRSHIGREHHVFLIREDSL